MNYRTGNIWDMRAQAKCFTTNATLNAQGENVMGAGIAKQVKDLWPTMPGILGHRISEYGSRVYVFRLDQFTNRFNCWYLISLPTKDDWKSSSSLWLINESLQQLKGIATTLGLEDILLPKPGCGLGNLSWDSVRPLCEDRLDDRFTIVDWKAS